MQGDHTSADAFGNDLCILYNYFFPFICLSVVMVMHTST